MIAQRICALRELSDSRVVMGFVSLPDEPDTMPMLRECLERGKRVYVPRTFPQERRMIPVRLRNLRELHAGGYGIPEPETEETCAAAEIDFLLVPGRAFDRKGNRLGRGAGFYDRFMASHGFRALRCAVAFSCQVLADIPRTPEDLPVQLLVTDEEIIRFA